MKNVFVVIGLTVAIGGCAGQSTTDVVSTQGQSGSTEPSEVSQPENTGTVPSEPAPPVKSSLFAGKVEIRDGNGTELFSFKPKDATSFKFYDAKGEELCKFSIDGKKLKAKSPDDKPLFELKAKDDKLMVKDATGETELFKIKFKSSDLDFYAPNDRRLYRIKKADYGYRLEDNADKTLYRSKMKDGKLVLRGIDDQTVLSTKDGVGSVGLVFFKIKELTTEQQAACLVFLEVVKR